MKRLILATLIAAAVAGVAPSYAADLGTDRPRGKHVRTAWQGSDWRDRCAWSGYYCLYAEYGYVYAYPFDDRPIANEYYARRHHRRF